MSDELEPIEQLRYFCSKHLPAEAWLDSEEYFETVVAEIKQLKKENRELNEAYQVLLAEIRDLGLAD